MDLSVQSCLDKNVGRFALPRIGKAEKYYEEENTMVLKIDNISTEMLFLMDISPRSCFGSGFH